MMFGDVSSMNFKGSVKCLNFVKTLSENGTTFTLYVIIGRNLYMAGNGHHLANPPRLEFPISADEI